MKKICISICFLLFAGSLWAEPITKEFAQKVAINFYKHQATNAADYSVLNVVEEELNGTPAYYVFNFTAGGFVIVAADDAALPILGYSMEGAFDNNNMPLNTRNWLDQYSRQMKEIIDSKLDNTVTKQKWQNLTDGNYVKNTTSVAPLCSTKWNQGCYFNELCPADTNGPCDHTYTGCVATAMAQIMKRWNYPIHGTGSHSYIHQDYGNLSADFGATTYQWGSMPDLVTSQNNAVATLMYHCGVALEMNYGPDESGSSIQDIPLIQYFNYSQNAHGIYLPYMDSATRINTLKNELDAGRPTWFAGQNSQMAGHSFVCDGYDANNLFHFNWGWGGSQDGYFEINNLNSNVMLYPYNNIVVIGIMPLIPNDIAVKEITTPLVKTFTGPEPIKVRIANYDTIAHSGIPVTYIVDGSFMVHDTVTFSIPAQSDSLFVFSQPYDFSAWPGHIYSVKVYSSFTNDTYNSNDTVSVTIENVECATPPYSMGFEASDDLYRWIITDANNDGRTWVVYPLAEDGYSQFRCAQYNLSSYLPANDWIISKCIQLESSKTYKLTYWFKAYSAIYPEKLKVFIGNAPVPGSLTTLLDDKPNVTNTTYLKGDVDFTVPGDGSYNIGWNCYSNTNMFFLYLDDINITETNYTDAAIFSITSPVSGCGSQDNIITVGLKNYGATALTNIPISYTVNGGFPVNEIVPGVVAPGDFRYYSFITPADLSQTTNFDIKVYTSVLADLSNENDTISTVFENNTAIVPYSTGFEPNEDFSDWSVLNINNDSKTWTHSSTGGHIAPACYKYSYNLSMPADDWLVSKCIFLDSSKTYKLSYWYKAGASVFPEKLKVYIGKAAQADSLTVLLRDFPNIINTTYLTDEVSFNVPVSGIYFIGWKCYSAADMFYLYLDDIMLQESNLTAINEAEPATVVNIYPNPATDKLTIETLQKATIEILNIEGQIIMTVNIAEKQTTIDISDLSGGIYFIKAKTDKGIAVKKFIKE